MRIRYLVATKELTGWCGDPTHGDCVHLERGRTTEALVTIDMEVPTGSLQEHRYNSETKRIERLEAIRDKYKSKYEDLKNGTHTRT